jgi:hypothetical protein
MLGRMEMGNRHTKTSPMCFWDDVKEYVGRGEEEGCVVHHSNIPYISKLYTAYTLYI